MEAVLLEALREELKTFASTSVRAELLALKESLISELRGDSQEAPKRSPVVSSEALHGAVEAEASPRRSRLLSWDRQNRQAEPAPRPQSTRSFAASVADSLLGQDESSEARQAMERDLQAKYGQGFGKKLRRSSRDASARYMSLESNEEGTPTSSRLSSCCTSILSSYYFDMGSAWLVVFNACWIGLSTDWVARNWSNAMPDYFHYGDWVFCVLALAELFVRMGAQGLHFFYEDHWKWNVFDTLVVATQVIDLLGSVLERSALTSQTSYQTIQGLRVLKLVRILRIARIASAFPELHILISSIIDSLQSLFWTMVLIFACLYAVSVVITQLVSDHKIAIGREEMEKEEKMLEFFGSMDTTMLSLYMVISEGIHWSELMEPLEENMGRWVRIVFVAFTGFELFAMMNIITACFVDSAMKIAAKAETQEVLDSLWGLLDSHATFDEASQQKVVTKEQFIGTYGEASMQKFLDLINAHTEDPTHVFAMIDRDGDGSLTAPEFLICCERLMGASKASMSVKIANEQRAKLAAQDGALQHLATELKAVLAKQDEILTKMGTPF